MNDNDLDPHRRVGEASSDSTAPLHSAQLGRANVLRASDSGDHVAVGHLNPELDEEKSYLTGGLYMHCA